MFPAGRPTVLRALARFLALAAVFEAVVTWDIIAFGGFLAQIGPLRISAGDASKSFGLTVLFGICTWLLRKHLPFGAPAINRAVARFAVIVAALEAVVT